MIAGTGGLLSLVRFHQDFGSRLEFVATTIAIAWLVIFGAVLIARLVRSLRTGSPIGPGRAAGRIGPEVTAPAEAEVVR